MPQSFHTTRWSLIVQAGASSSPAADQALEELCRLYWYPLYAFARREGLSSEEAEDVTQGFFVSLLERKDLRNVSEEKGRFRSFLRTAMKHYLLNHWRAEKALKRGGGRSRFPIDRQAAEQRYAVEPVETMTAEKLFDRQWALTLLDFAMQQLRIVYRNAGKENLYEILKTTLTGSEESNSFAELGELLGMSEGAARTAAYRLRKDFQKQLREEVAETLHEQDEAALEEEISRLFSALSG